MVQGIKIGSNVASLTAQRRLSDAQSSLSGTYERLSSGQRINKASDDAAGLAIADALNAKTKISKRAVQNLNDGISVVAIADSAVSALTDITARIAELAEQAANGTYSNKQREALDKEAQTLAKEYFRISRTTQFNGVRLFDGSVQGLALQAGLGTDGAISSTLGGQLGTGSFGTAATMDTGAGTAPYYIATGDVNRDGAIDLLTANWQSSETSVFLGNGDGTFKAKVNFSVGSGPYAIALGDLNGDGALDVVSADQSGTGVSLLTGNGDGTFNTRISITTGTPAYFAALGDLNSDGFQDIVTANGAAATASVLLGNGDGTFKAATNLAAGASAENVSLGDLNGDGVLDIVTSNLGSANVSVMIGNGDGTFKARANYATAASPGSLVLGDVNGDGALDIFTGNNSSSTSVLLGNGDGTFKTHYELTSDNSPRLALGDLNGDGALDLVATRGTFPSASIYLGNGDGTFQNRSDFNLVSRAYGLALADLNSDGVLDLASSSTLGQNVSVLIAQTRDGISPLLPFSLRTKADALQAIAPINETLERLNIQHGVLGAFESRLSSATATLGAAVENYSTAESRIRDVDIAEESANLARKQILQQVGTAILGQANQQPQIALTLLKNG